MPDYYQIRLKGHIDPSWSAWFDGLTITHERDGSSTLAGPVVDSSALYGVIAKVRDLGLTLIAVTLVGQQGSDDLPDQVEQRSLP